MAGGRRHAQLQPTRPAAMLAVVGMLAGLGSLAHDVVSVPFAGGPLVTLVRNAFAASWSD